MANTLNGNTWYVDTAHASASDDLALNNLMITHVVVTATAASAVLVLADAVNGNKKFDFRVATSGESRMFRFDEFPLRFPNGIKVQTLTNAVALIVGAQSGGS